MRCELCGQRVDVHSGSEGTNSYIPVAENEIYRIQAEVDKLNKMLDDRKIFYRELDKKLVIAWEALSLIAAPKRPDGTYNRSREACERLAHKALTAMDKEQGP